MYALALALGGASALPYFHLGSLDIGIPIQAFGVIVAVGVLIGAGLLRRYGEWHGVSDDHIRGITGWVTVAGFIGAHVFDVLFYQWKDFEENPILILQVWKGISSYGGFIGGVLGWWFYVWWKRLPMRLMADVTMIGFLVAFTIGRLACTVVSDHIGSAVDVNEWYSVLAMDYPRAHNPGDLAQHYPGTSQYIRAWNLGLLEFLYLIPVNAFILWYAFRSSKRPKAGMVTVLTGLLYAPVRFVLDYLRVNPDADPRYFSLTFAQWASIAVFGAAIAYAIRIAKNGKPADTVAKTSGDAQRALKTILKDDDDKKDPPPKAIAKETAKPARVDDENSELAKEAEAARLDGDDDDDDDDEEVAPGASKPASTKPRPQGGGSSNKNKKRKR